MFILKLSELFHNMNMVNNKKRTLPHIIIQLESLRYHNFYKDAIIFCQILCNCKKKALDFGIGLFLSNKECNIYAHFIFQSNGISLNKL